MPVVSIPRNYSDGSTLTESHLDAALDAVETALNSTKLDSSNIQSGGIATANYAALSVDAAALAADAVTTAKIADANVTRSKIEANERFPVGMVSPFAGTSAPDGWLLCNGSAVSRSTYSALFAVIGEAFGEGNNTTTFNVPDLRGRFVRGLDNGAGRDPDASSRTAMNTGGNTGDAVGSVQGSQNLAHTHTINNAVVIGASGGISYSAPGGSSFALAQDSGSYQTTSSNGGESRPINAYLNYIIKY